MKFRSEIWLADLNPQIGSEAGKIRPVLILQTDLLNEHGHTSTIICPFTTKIRNAEQIRVFIEKGVGGLAEDSEIMVDQVRAIDNSRFVKKIGKLPHPKMKLVENYLKVLLDLA